MIGVYYRGDPIYYIEADYDYYYRLGEWLWNKGIHRCILYGLNGKGISFSLYLDGSPLAISDIIDLVEDYLPFTDRIYIDTVKAQISNYLFLKDIYEEAERIYLNTGRLKFTIVYKDEASQIRKVTHSYQSICELYQRFLNNRCFELVNAEEPTPVKSTTLLNPYTWKNISTLLLHYLK
jgi:hypothetical protein